MTKIVKKDETPVKAVEAVKAPAAVVETKAVKEVKAAPKAAEKKTAPKAAEKKAAPKAKAATKTAKAIKTAKKAAPKAKAAKAPKAEKAASNVKVFVQYHGSEIAMDAIVESVKAAAGVKSAKSLEVYVKPEDGAAYYVVNGKDTGKVTL